MPRVQTLVGIFRAEECFYLSYRIGLFLLEFNVPVGDGDAGLLNLDLCIDILELVAGRICLLDSILQLAKENAFSGSAHGL